MPATKRAKSHDPAKDADVPKETDMTPPKKNRAPDSPKNSGELVDTDEDCNASTENIPSDNNNSTVKSPGKSHSKQSTLHVKKRPKLAKVNFNQSPRKFRSPDKLVTRALTTVLTRDGAIIAEINTAEGKLCYNKHLVDFIKDDPERARVSHGVDCVMVARDPLDPTKVYTQETNYRGKDITKLRNLFININYSNNTTLDYRNSWGKHMVDLHNAPRFQKQLFGTNNRAFYAGDITPVKGERPYISEFLTIKYTINLIDMSFADQPLEDLMRDNAVLSQYFPADMFQQVREYYNGPYKKDQEDAMPKYDDDVNDDDIPTFEP